MWWWAGLALAGTLTGTVRERGSGAPLVCTVSASGREVRSDPRGRFRIQDVAGPLRVSIRCGAHPPLKLTESVGVDQVVEVEYRVEPLISEQVVVFGDAERSEVSRTRLSQDELRRVPGAFGDPVRALQSLPGVARPNGPEGALVVRGAEGLNTLTTLDGVPVPYLFHFFVGRSVVDPALVEGVALLPGALPARYGDTAQAIVDVQTLSDRPAVGLHGTVRVDPLDASVVARTRAGPWDLTGAFRYAWVGAGIAAAARLSAVASERPAWEASWAYPRYLDHHLRLRRRWGGDTFTATLFGARDALVIHPGRVDADGDGVPEAPPDLGLPYDPKRLLDQWFHRLDVRWDHEGAAHRSTTRLVGGPDLQHNLLLGLGPLGDGPELGRITGGDVILSREDRSEISERRVIESGARLWLRPVRTASYRDVVTPSDAVVTDAGTRVSAGVWADLQEDHGGFWTGTGLRLAGHAFDGQSFFVPEPRISITGVLSDTWSASWFVGRFSQPPPADRWAAGLGSSDVGLMTAWQTSGGVSARWSNGVGLDITAYGASLGGVVVERQTWGVDRTDADSAVPRRYTAFESAEGRTVGLETLLRLQPRGRFFGWLAATYGRSWRFVETGRFVSDRDQPVVLTAVGAVSLPRGWGLSTRVRASSGSPFTPQSAVYDAELDLWFGLSGGRNSERLPWFRQVDLRVDKVWVARRATWTVYLDVYNSTNTRNPLLVSYTPNFERTVPTVYVPIVPLLGLEVTY